MPIACEASSPATRSRCVVCMVSALAGDRTLTGKEQELLADHRKCRVDLFYSDILYAITHQYFPPAEAERLWSEILEHKYEMSRKLHRNVQVTVATLDYLANLKREVLLPTLVTEPHIAEIVRSSMRDGLTGLFNHTSCYEILNLHLKTYARHGTVVSLILLDIDDFKVINDRCGHPEGDRVLKELAKTIKNTARESDICCRYGGRSSW